MTAKEAYSLAMSKLHTPEVDEKVDEMLFKIKEASNKGKFMVFWDENYSQDMGNKVASRLYDLGFLASYREKDKWGRVTWYEYK